MRINWSKFTIWILIHWLNHANRTWHQPKEQMYGNKRILLYKSEKSERLFYSCKKKETTNKLNLNDLHEDRQSYLKLYNA